MRLLLFAPVLVACVPLHRDDGQHVQRLCLDKNYAYETGYNVGLQRGRLDTSWVTQCAPERAEGIRYSYQTGYNTGIENAPMIVKHDVRGQHNHSVTSSGESCRFSSDCGEDRTCRHGTCYGQGWRGDVCMFSTDCNSRDCDLSSKSCR